MKIFQKDFYAKNQNFFLYGTMTLKSKGGETEETLPVNVKLWMSKATPSSKPPCIKLSTTSDS